MKITFGNLFLLMCFCLFELTQVSLWIYGPFLFVSFVTIYACFHELTFLRLISMKETMNVLEIKSFIHNVNTSMRTSSFIILCINWFLIILLLKQEFYFVSIMLMIAIYVKISRDLIFDVIKSSPQYLNLKAAIEKLRTVS